MPSVQINCSAEISFSLQMQGVPEGLVVDAHEIIVEIGSDGQRALWSGVVCIPEFIY